MGQTNKQRCGKVPHCKEKLSTAKQESQGSRPGLRQPPPLPPRPPERAPTPLDMFMSRNLVKTKGQSGCHVATFGQGRSASAKKSWKGNEDECHSQYLSRAVPRQVCVESKSRNLLGGSGGLRAEGTLKWAILMWDQRCSQNSDRIGRCWPVQKTPHLCP